VKVGDLVRWKSPGMKPPFSVSRKHAAARIKESYGIVIGHRGVFFYILWMDGTYNGNVEWQMEVISESR